EKANHPTQADHGPLPKNSSSEVTLAQQEGTVKCWSEGTYSAQVHRAVGVSGRGRSTLHVVSLELPRSLLVARHDPLHIRAGLVEGWHAAVTLHIALAGVVGGDRLLQVSVQTPLQVLQ